MRKTIIILFCIYAISCNVYSQQNKVDSVLLNNGNLYCGKIIQYTPNKSIKIKTGTGVLTFVDDDIQSFHIHTTEYYSEGFDLSGKYTTIKSSLTGMDSITTETTKTVRKKQLNFEPDGFPINPIMIQGGADRLTIYSLDNIYSQHKLQAIYSHRYWKDIAFGVGYVYRDLDESSYHNLFLDARYYNMIEHKKFSSFALDLGLGKENFYSFLNDLSLYMNTSYNYGVRLDQYVFLTFGIDLNLQTNGSRHYESYANGYNFTGYDNNFTLGFTLGILF
ncbi:MAG: hypothetical protein PHT07_12450 [Paludibacter sp.]|nr:hypothetical protein [Paludibacter sp.]